MRDTTKEWWALAFLDGRVGRVYQGRKVACDAVLAYMAEHGGLCDGTCGCRKSLTAIMESDEEWPPALALHNISVDDGDDVLLALGRLQGPGDPEVPIMRQRPGGRDEYGRPLTDRVYD